jgi:redox-sensitive bicupin YhaK (pirin superfamily)
MIHQAKGKIFLADQRGLNETASFRSMNTFNFGNYFNEHKQAFGDMYVLNDDTLAGGYSIKMLVEEDSCIILVPVAGAIKYTDMDGNDNIIAAGQVQAILLNKGCIMEITNPFSDQPVNFLQIWFRANKSNQSCGLRLSTYDDVNENLNRLVKASSEDPDTTMLPFKLAIGKFSGRGETVYHSAGTSKGIFVFVIEGAFEVAGRLLHAGDGMALWETLEVEMEALSNDAIISVIEH